MDRDEIVFGIHAVDAALKRGSGHVSVVWIAQGADHKARLRPIIDAAQQCGAPVKAVTREELDGLADSGRHQGVVARCRAVRHGDEGGLKEFLAGLAGPAFLLVLDGVQDPHNLGACLRSADAAGVQAVVVPRDRAAGLTAVVRKVASGAAETMPFFQVTNLARALRILKDAGVWVIGADGGTETSLYDIDLTGPLALVLGAEGGGMRRLTREHCDVLAKIPMAGQVESLNVSVAAGIFLFEAARQRLPGN